MFKNWKRSSKNVTVNCSIVGVLIFMFLITLMVKQQQGPLTLEDYPWFFKQNTIVVVGENTTEIEYEIAEIIVSELKIISGNEPTIKKDANVTKQDKFNSNLIIIGTPCTNSLLREIYKTVIYATKVTNEWPEENKGVVEILRNPWNSNKALLIIAGSNEWGVKAGNKLLEQIQNIGKNSVIVEWKESKGTFARTIPLDKYIFIEIRKRVKFETPLPRLMIDRYPLTYYFDEISGNLKIWAMGGLSAKGKLTINDDLAVLIGNMITIEKVGSSGQGIMPPVYAVPFSFQKKDLDFLKIIYLESDGTVYLRYRDKKIVLRPKEEYETSFRENSGAHMTYIKNHGLLDKERIIVE